GFKTLLKDAGALAAIEGGEELSQQVKDKILRKIWNEEQSLFEGGLQSFVVGSLMGGGMGAGVSAVSPRGRVMPKIDLTKEPTERPVAPPITAEVAEVIPEQFRPEVEPDLEILKTARMNIERQLPKAENVLQIMAESKPTEFNTVSNRINEILNKPAFQWTAEDKVFIRDAVLKKDSPFGKDIPIKSKIEIIKAIEGKPTKPPISPTERAIAETKELKSSDIINDMTINTAVKKLADGDKSVLPDIQEGIDKYGISTMQHNVRNKLQAEFYERMKEKGTSYDEEYKAFGGIRVDLDKVLAGEKITPTEVAPAIAPAKEALPERKVAEPQDIIRWVMAKGGINLEKEYHKRDVKDLKDYINLNMGKRFGYRAVRESKGSTLDRLALMAKDEGYITEASPQALLDAMYGRKELPSVAEGRIGAEMEKQNITTKQEGKTAIDPATLKEGDKVIVDNVEYTHKGEDAKGNIKLENDYNLRLDAFDTLYVDKIIPKEEFKLTPEEIKAQKIKPVELQLPLGAEKEALEGKIPVKELPETELERAKIEAEARKAVAEEQKAQIPIEEKPTEVVLKGKDEYRKVRAGDYNVRYIDKDGNWWKKEFNGEFKKSRTMPIEKEYGVVRLKIEDDTIYGKRLIEEIKTEAEARKAGAEMAEKQVGIPEGEFERKDFTISELVPDVVEKYPEISKGKQRVIVVKGEKAPRTSIDDAGNITINLDKLKV
ncbi:MAG: hypothetical protein Q8M94_01500, partial [Ignavibacteria bacterium]|nr:hypothetical protein [Ignavibacteria bacterium]